MKKSYFFFFLIIGIGILLRFYKLGETPAGLYRDEAFLGYNAFSILKTGRDMSGNFLPLHLQSFLYSPAGYSYVSIPFIAVFGLNAFSIRFASALFGSLTIIVVYFFIDELFKNKKLALLSSLIMAISPWHVNLSRLATENIVVTFFIILGVLLYVKKRILLSFLSFFLTLLVYQAPRAFLPVFIPLMLFLFSTKKRPISMLFYVALIVIPTLFIVTNPNLSLRIRTVSLFASQNTQLSLNEYIREDGVQGTGAIVSRLFHNKIAGYLPQFLENYAAHFSYNFLFTDKGLPDRYRIPGMGLLYLVELPFLLIGLIRLIKRPNKENVLIIGWTLLAPVGSALTFDDIPNLQRTLFAGPAFAVLSAVGILSAVTYLKNRFPKRVFLAGAIVLGTLAFYNVAFFIHQYFIHLPVHKPWYRNEGYEELVPSINKLLPTYTKAVITNRESAPAIFFLFYSQYDPAKFQAEAKQGQTTDLDRVNFGPYEFSQEECPLRLNEKTKTLTGNQGILYVDYGTCKIPEGATLLKKIRRGDQSLVFQIVSLQ